MSEELNLVPLEWDGQRTACQPRVALLVLALLQNRVYTREGQEKYDPGVAHLNFPDFDQAEEFLATAGVKGGGGLGERLSAVDEGAYESPFGLEGQLDGPGGEWLYRILICHDEGGDAGDFIADEDLPGCLDRDDLDISVSIFFPAQLIPGLIKAFYPALFKDFVVRPSAADNPDRPQPAAA